MSRLIRFVLLVLCAFPGTGIAAPASELDALLGHYRHLHENPELSLQERNTSAYLAEQLTATGFDVTTGVGGYGIVATLRNGDGPVILFRTDMDALPIAEQTDLPYRSTVRAVNTAGEDVPVMHACGHDIHMTVLLGIARHPVADCPAGRGNRRRRQSNAGRRAL
jgi:metal-dependent amidase/aminoacylase/carboxypeptidase family protein